MSKMDKKIALVHDYLREYGGAERVVETLHHMFPQAPLYVALFDAQRLGEHATRFTGWDIRESKLAHWPFSKRLVSPLRVVSAWAFEQLDLSEYDVVISSTNMYMAKAVRTKPEALHISYVHTPPRSLYGHTTMTNWKKNPLIRVGGELINFWMRYVDFKTAQRPDILIANSRTTQQRINKYYRRSSLIIPPPVAMVDAKVTPLPMSQRKYALYVGRMAFSKHPELAVMACKELDIPLKVAGVGAMLPELQRYASKQIQFLGAVDDQQLAKLYREARVVIFPAEDEDFGIVPIEAMACGTPVVVHFSGEPRYTVKPKVSGLHVTNLERKDWKKGVKEAWDFSWDPRKIQETVQAYSEQEFREKIQHLIKEKR